MQRYRRFIRWLHRHGRPAIRAIECRGTLEQADAYRKLIGKVKSPPVLALLNRGRKYSLDTDASAHQVGCALFQTDEEVVRRPFGFWSRTLAPAERNCSASERECLAVVYGITTCRPYLYGERFTFHTDHAALRWLVEISDPSGRLMRWCLQLAEYTFDVQYKKAKLNCQADAVSRIPSLFQTVPEDDAEIPCYAVAHDSEKVADTDVENDVYFDEHDRVAQQAPGLAKTRRPHHG